LDDIQPDEIYNLAAQSHVRISFDVPQFTVQTNAIGVLNILEAYRRSCPTAKFYQASSSEMFGNSVDEDGFQRESTAMSPVSLMVVLKYLDIILLDIINAYKLHACNGILFNHESPRRASNFVTNKVVKTAVEIKYGITDKLELGNMDSYRDWGHSKRLC
jgi:GDPmannose 4,6-dehydratase